MTPEQRDELFQVSAVGLQWIAGKITIEDAQKMLGKMDDMNVGGTHSYFLDGHGFAAVFSRKEQLEQARDGIASEFHLGVEAWLTSTIPRDMFDSRLDLQRVVPGELIDGVRREGGHYFNPHNISPRGDPDMVTLLYRYQMPNDSLFDVTARIDYMGQGTDESLDDTQNFRRLTFYRDYLSADKQRQRDEARQYK
ncbi:hypothetical protein [Paraburkholderia sp.]|uniref:hypothetical protein n=1 Tax=Paraburkholderia sp. TaxID=1926495 RepID=UPI0039E5491B